MKEISTEQVIDAMQSAAVGSDSASRYEQDSARGRNQGAVLGHHSQRMAAYKRLYSYALPYKWRFIVGLGFGFLYGIINSCLPLVMAKRCGRRVPRPRARWHRSR